MIWLYPLTTCSLLIGQLVQQENMLAMFLGLGWYCLTNAAAMLLHSLIFLPTLYFVITRKSPVTFFQKMFKAIVVSFGTASSSATLPVTIECVESKLKVDPTISRFVLLLGATVNMDGTAIYRVVMVNYLAQLCGITLSLSELINLA